MGRLKKWGAGLCAALFFLLTAIPAQAFSDVSPGAWYGDAVTQMADQGLLSGYPDGTFKPGKVITGGEFVSVVVRCAGVSPGAGQATHWAAGWVQAALDKGWLDWDELPPTGELFDSPITRQLAVKVAMRALLPDARGDYVTESAKIKDFSQLSGRYYEAVLAAYATGVVSGFEDGTFRPLGTLTRAEACMLVQKILGLTGGTSPTPQPPAQTVTGGVSENGWLQVKGAQLCNEKGEPILLRGMSSHGIQWFGQFACPQAIANTASFGANLFRVAMYTGEGGYISHPEETKKQAIVAIDTALAQDMYVIIDWHILSDGNPMTYKDQAVAFFGELAQRYKDNPGVIYEICNEPNGSAQWGRDIKPYAEQVMKAIRAHSQGIILIGSSTWSQDIHLAAADPVSGENLMYTLHFYAGTHGQELRTRIDQARAQGLPVFVSEWGTSRADGSGGVFLPESAQWLDFLEGRGISWANWSLCDKDETSAALRPGTPATRAWTSADLTPSGQFVFSRLG